MIIKSSEYWAQLDEMKGEWEILYHEKATACMFHVVAFDEELRSKESSLRDNKR